MKKLMILSAVFFFVAFTSLVSAQTQSGTWSTKAGDSGYNLDTNTGERAMTIEVMLSVTQIDGDKTFNQRFNVEVLSVSRDGFTVKIRTWADSKIYSISGYWLSYTN